MAQIRRSVILAVLVTLIAPVPGATSQTGAMYFDAEATKAVLEAAVLEAAVRDQPVPLILIAHLGGGERSHRIAKQRLDGLRAYAEDKISQIATPRSREHLRVITAVGEPEAGPGRVNIYVAGRLHASIHFKRGRGVDFRLS